MTFNLPKEVQIVEVGPRDGLQNLSICLSIEDRIDLINQLSETGLSCIEVGSFVSKNKVPQMANTADVYRQINRKANISYPALTPNLRGLEDGLAVNIQEIAIFGSASNTFCEKNMNCSRAESIQRFQSIINTAHRHKIRVRGYLSCIVTCPYEGFISPDETTELASILYDMGCYQISLGDTTGTGTPHHIATLLNRVYTKVSSKSLAVHFHNTYGQALANVLIALQQGITVIDSAIGGLGGCPYAPGSTGNVASEDLLFMLEGCGIRTGVNLNKLIQISQTLTEKIGCKNTSHVSLSRKHDQLI
ncbi:MAG: hydroxymethylglutaryl-CoA lyase [Endozoicomonadaceae bacterium]|nr:hydroxymethylglutaryl-CoA lyase [Endozoicomonadaceae bacterium]MBE8233213.1 hydroxymethylglutaryl-CoA lyase [Endozoicomonadaceae bacterium]